MVTDIQMPGMSGLELLQEIRRRWPSCQVIFLSAWDDFEYAHHAIKYHAARYVLKNEGDDVLLEAIRETIAMIEKEEKTAPCTAPCAAHWESAWI